MKYSIFRKDSTAQGVAKQRLIESLAKPDKRIINDPFADKFVIGASVTKLMGHNLGVWLSQKFAPGFHEHIISRTRYIDDLIEKCAVNDAEQYVILGAGYDLRAHRLKLPARLKIFEVDQPEVQRRKRSKLPSNLPNSDNVSYVPVNFNHQTLKSQLREAGFNENKPTVFTLEGVTQYIPKNAFISTIKELSELTQKTNAILFISYVDKLLNENPQACFGKGYPNAEIRVKTLKRLAASVGEPWISFYSSEEISSLLSQEGFVLTENKTLADLNSVYFAPVGRRLSEDQMFKLEHFVIAKTENLITNSKQT